MPWPLICLTLCPLMLTMIVTQMCGTWLKPHINSTGACWTTTICLILGATVLNLCREKPYSGWIDSLRQFVDALCTKFHAHPSLARAELIAIACFLSCMAGLLQARHAATSSARSRCKFYSSLRGFEPALANIFVWHGDLPSERLVTRMIEFLSLQVQAIFGDVYRCPEMNLIYRLANGLNSYIGRTALMPSLPQFGGLTHRWTEHVRMVMRHLAN